MKPMIHTLSCNIVTDPAKNDRFFMDMRVYQVVPQALDFSVAGTQSLVWRGIYLAVEVGSAPPLASRSSE